MIASEDPLRVESTLLAKGLVTTGPTGTSSTPRKRTTPVTILTRKLLKQGAIEWGCIQGQLAKAA